MRFLPPTEIHLADGGQLRLWPHWLPEDKAWAAFEGLQRSLHWRQGCIRIFGKEIPEPRLSAWYGDPQTLYKYSGQVHTPNPWESNLTDLRFALENQLQLTFNSVLANLYRDENDSMGWHADNEVELGTSPVIASLSLGATRRFWLKHPRAKKVCLQLSHGSLLLMEGKTQHHWKHSIPKESSYRAPRMNLTFRNIVTSTHHV